MLRSPEFGNVFRFISNTVVHRTVNQNLRTFQRPLGPMWEGFRVQFKALNQEKINEFRAFVLSTVGEIIDLNDFEGRTWTGIITSTEILIRRGKGSCNYQTEFEFEGVTGDVLDIVHMQEGGNAAQINAEFTIAPILASVNSEHIRITTDTGFVYPFEYEQISDTSFNFNFDNDLVNPTRYKADIRTNWQWENYSSFGSNFKGTFPR